MAAKKSDVKLKTVRSNSKKSTAKPVKRPAPKPVLIDGKHPLVALRETVSLETLYRSLGHKNHSTVSVYCARAAKDKRMTVPAEWVIPLSVVTGVPMANLRPDLYEPSWPIPGRVEPVVEDSPQIELPLDEPVDTGN